MAGHAVEHGLREEGRQEIISQRKHRCKSRPAEIPNCHPSIFRANWRRMACLVVSETPTPAASTSVPLLSFLAGASLGDIERLPLQLRPVQSRDCSLCFRLNRHLDKTEPLRDSGEFILYNCDSAKGAKRLEKRTKIGLSNVS